MKKTLCVIAVMVIPLSVFFYAPVNAATSTDIVARMNTTITIEDQVQATIGIVQLKPTASEWSFSPSALANTTEYAVGTVDVMCTVQIRNYTDVNKYITNIVPWIEVDMPTGIPDSHNVQFNSIVEIQNFSDDLKLMNSANNNWGLYVYPSVDWSYDSGFIVLPHNNITAIAIIRMPCLYLRDLDRYKYATVSAIGITSSAATSATTSVNPAGSNADVTQAIDNLYQYLSNNNYGLPRTNELIGYLHTDLVTINGKFDVLHQDLRDIYNIYNSQNSNNVSNDSGTLKNQSDSVHSQEASYYAANSQAIQATGLSNYQFDSSAVSGLTGVRGDFIDVWNSLGGWNAVYIFSLTLGLALTILRHSPSAISSALRRRRDNNG